MPTVFGISALYVWGESTIIRQIASKKASDKELAFYLLHKPDRAVEQAIELHGILDASHAARLTSL